MVAGGWGAPRGKEVMGNGHGVPFRGDGNVLKLVVVMAAQACEYTKN